MGSDPPDHRNFVVLFKWAKDLRVDDRGNNDRSFSPGLDVFSDISVAANNNRRPVNQLVGLTKEFESTAQTTIGRTYISDVGCVVQVKNHREPSKGLKKSLKYSRTEWHRFPLHKEKIV